MQVYFAIALSIVAAVLAVAPYVPALRSRLSQPEQLAPLVPLCLLLVAMLAPQPVSMFYKAAILLGLLASTLAVLFRRLPGMPLYASLAFLCITVPLYAVAFASTHRLSLPTPLILLVIVWAAGLYWVVRAHLHEERYALIGLITLAGLMGWQALEMQVHNGQVWSSTGLAGALLMGVAGTLLLVDRARKPIRGAAVLVALVFFVSQTLIAWSVWGPGISLT
jgi:uncharacterized membrane protein YhhN